MPFIRLRRCARYRYGQYHRSKLSTSLPCLAFLFSFSLFHHMHTSATTAWWTFFSNIILISGQNCFLTLHCFFSSYVVCASLIFHFPWFYYHTQHSLYSYLWSGPRPLFFSIIPSHFIWFLITPCNFPEANFSICIFPFCADAIRRIFRCYFPWGGSIDLGSV